MISLEFLKKANFRLVSGVLTLLLLSTLVNSARAMIIKSYDKDRGCQKYEVINEEEKIPSHQKIYNDRKHYGLAVNELKIDFEREQVSAVITQKIILGFNRSLIPEHQKIVISRHHDRFEEFVDLHNRDLGLLRSICLRGGSRGDQEVVGFEKK